MLSSSQCIRDIAANQPSTIALFERFNIDVCSFADKSLSEACCELRLSLDQVLEKLGECRDGEEDGSGLSNPSGLSCAQLIQHIVRVHHQRVRQDLPSLVRQAHKLADIDGEAPALKTLEKLVTELQQEMLSHIQKEEGVLFPFIVQMEEGSILAYPPAHACFRTVSHPVFMMVQEHEAASSIMQEIRSCTEEFSLPESACPTHRAMFDGLRAFEIDLLEHVRLENDFLFPRSIQMEAAIQSGK